MTQQAPSPTWFCACGHGQTYHFVKTRSLRSYDVLDPYIYHDEDYFPCSISGCDCEEFEVSS